MRPPCKLLSLVGVLSVVTWMFGCANDLEYAISLYEDPRSLYAVAFNIDGVEVKDAPPVADGYLLAAYLIDADSDVGVYEKTLEARNIKTGRRIGGYSWKLPWCKKYMEEGDQVVAERVVFHYSQGALRQYKLTCFYEHGPVLMAVE